MSSYPSVTPAPVEKAPRQAAIKSLFVVSLAIIAMFFLAVSYGRGDDPDPEKFALYMCVVLLGSIYVFLGLVEVKLMHRLVDLKSSLFLWAFFMACLAYVAKTRASVDINAVFHTESSAFPMTLAAATILHMISLLFWFFFLTGLSCLCIGLLSCKQDELNCENRMMITCQIVIGFAFLMLAAFSHFRIDSVKLRSQMIYRIAQAVDFNAHSPCTNIDKSITSMVFLDADKRLALLAPVLDDFISMEWRRVSLLRSVTIPQTFEIVTCEYLPREKDPEVSVPSGAAD
ncbi:hypothetical protein NVV30_06015 [Pseudomonas syringae]|uniref:hypothetical protein n=1 Tax=Pseudomonas syringae TaxID=317 RepID=UPI00215A327A|nr:hypothetical protein [Pseudomonas syringae]MCR8718249.1 hypothetical protein [Pseudomonas syringae]